MDPRHHEHLRQRVPDAIAVNSSIGLRAIELAAPGVPIVFIAVSEPVTQGFVASLAHPGGTYGFLQSGTDSRGEMARSAQADRADKRLVLRLSTIRVIPATK